MLTGRRASDDIDIPEDIEESQTHVDMGAKQPACTFEDLAARFQQDTAFSSFRTRLVTFLRSELGRDDIQLLGQEKVRLLIVSHAVMLRIIQAIIEYQFLKVHFESCIDWRTDTDYLRCTPKFHGHARYDHAIIKINEHDTTFAQILFIFKCTVLEQEYSIALVQPFDEPIPTRERPRKDRDLEFLRIRARSRKQSRFIFVGSMIRGSLLVDARGSNANDRLVVDTLDTDMFLRLRDQTRCP